MNNNNELLAIQVGSGLVAITVYFMPVISTLFMIVSIATGLIHIYKFFSKKK